MRKLDIRGADVQTDQRVKLLALWQANQDQERAQPDGWSWGSIAVVVVMWAGLVVLWVLEGDF